MRALLVTLMLLLPTISHAQDRYIGVIIGSAHIGNDNLNNLNPGLTYGHRWETHPGIEWHVEGGVFYNSYEEVSPLVLAGVSTHLFTMGNIEIRGGLSTGLGYYPTLATQLKRDYGIPNIEGFIPLAAATLSARVGNTDFRLTTVPPDSDTTAIFNFSIAQSF